MIIREAVHADVDDLVAMGRRFRAGTVYADLIPDNPEQMAVTAHGLIESCMSVIWVAEGVGGDIVGMIGLLCFPHPMSGELTAMALFFWSEDGSSGPRLFDRAKKWALALGVKKMQAAHPIGAEKVGRFYAHEGFEPIEESWQLDLAAS